MINLNDLDSFPEHLDSTFLDDTTLSEKTAKEFLEQNDKKQLSMILHMLQSILSVSVLDNSVPEKYPALAEVVKRLDLVLNEEKMLQLAQQIAPMLLERVSEVSVLGVILLHTQEGAFGIQLQANLITILPDDKRAELTELISQQLEQAREAVLPDKAIVNSLSELYSSLQEKREINFDSMLEDDSLQDEISELIESKEVMNLLPAEVNNYIASEDFQRVRALLHGLRKKINSDADGRSTEYTGAFCLVTELLIQSRKEELLVDHIDFYSNWLKNSIQADFFFEKYAEALHAIANHALKKGDLDTGQRIVDVFTAIRSGAEKKSPPVKAMTARIQDRMVTVELLDGLVAQYLQNPVKQNQTGSVLIALGMNGIIHLLNSLIEAEKKETRFALIDLLETAGPTLPPAILKIMNHKLPWYGKRNLLQLLGKTGNATHAERVVDMGRDDDLRIQNEALNCLQLIAGNSLHDVLLQSFAYVADELKLKILELIRPEIDEVTAEKLLKILEEIGSVEHLASKQWFEMLCLVLVDSGSSHAHRWLKNFVQESKKSKTIPQTSSSVVEQALLSLGLSSSDETSASDKGKADKKPEEQRDKITPLAQKIMAKPANPAPKGITFLPKEKEARALFEKGEEDDAIELVMELIIQMSKERKFEQADKLREWLIEAAPMALIKAIQAAEIIQEQKTQAIDRGHLEVWSELYDILSTEEFSTLYHSMQHRRYGSGEVIIEQHTRLPALFFVNRGKVKLYYSDSAGSEVLVRVAGPGDIIGVDTFFNSSLWTINASTMGAADVSRLRFESQQKWNDEFPALESKLHDFCLKYESLQEFFRNTSKDRRQSERKKIEGRVATVLLDSERKATKVSAKGELFDISQGGLSFFMRISAKDHSRILLGHHIRIFLPIDMAVPGKVKPVDGMIVAVRAHLIMENEYSIHVRFEEKIDTMQVKRFINAAKGLSSQG